MKKNSSIYEVAKLAGVSPMTVTRTFNGKAPVAQTTRERVQKAARELDFRPNLLARDLKSGSTRSVGVFWSLCHPYLGSGQVRRISQRMLKEGYSCHFVDSLSDPELLVGCLEDFAGRRTEAVIIDDGSNVTRDERIVNLLRCFKAVLLVRRKWRSPLEFDQIVTNPNPAFEALFRMFKNDGRRLLGIFNPRPEHTAVFNRLSQETGLPIEFLHTRDEHEEYRNCEAEYIRINHASTIPFDAILSYVDETAAALVGYLLDRGIRVPEEIAVCGYNNSPIAEYFRPPIASIEREDPKLGAIIADMLLERLADPAAPRRTRMIDQQFIPRRSAGTDFNNQGEKNEM